ncbi:MAG TPA: response regulator [Streptosporangiaceae bacterium]|nr:response regulator [Streptosporangiaceae bacterium]
MLYPPAATDLLITSGAEARRRNSELQPDVTLVDIDLGEENGFDLARHLIATRGADRPRVILISAYSEDDFADLIAASPALSFLPKSDLSGAAIRRILADACGGAAG